VKIWKNERCPVCRGKLRRLKNDELADWGCISGCHYFTNDFLKIRRI